MILYHGSNNLFNQFNLYAEKKNRISNWMGIYFVSKKKIDYAKNHGRYLYICEVDLGNYFMRGKFRPTAYSLFDLRNKLNREYNDPNYVDGKLNDFMRGGEPSLLDGEDLTKIAIKNGYDSMIDGSIDYGEVCVFNTNKIRIINIIDTESNTSLFGKEFSLNESLQRLRKLYDRKLIIQEAIKAIKEYKKLNEDILEEAEYKGKKVKLRKPFRSSGPKKFAVYVKNPRTGKVIKVNFGQKGMKVRNNNPKAAKSFVKRHKCSQKNDPTKPGYWSCRVGRYSKSLGLTSSSTW